MLQDNSFGSSKTSPPMAPFSLDQLGAGMSRPSFMSHSYGLSQSSQRQTSDRSLDSHPPSLTASISDPATFMPDPRATSTIIIRRLPRNTSSDAVNAMLLFSGDLIGTDIISSPYGEDHAYTTAIAQFRSSAGAYEAQAKLQGKSVTSKDAAIIVEIQSFERRATIDGVIPRQESGSTSSSSSHNGPPPGRSRFGSTFQSSDKISPPLPTPTSVGSANGFGVPDPNHIQSLFSPISPLSDGLEERFGFRTSGKAFINNDNLDDDETGELLKDPLAYAKSGQQARRSSQAQVVSHLGRLSLSTGATNGSHSNFAPPSASHSSTPRGSQALQAPHSPTNITNMNSGRGYNSNMQRAAQFPPVNPADQNAPCNTLYVGNLPIDTSEDELKTIFTRARGYKRMCFRTKQNGPMCFVEFEDTGYATVALNELYGTLLHNSTKGGIRLSYSKNPLGVRSGQANGMPPNGMYPHPLNTGNPGYATNGNGAGGAPNFTAVSGPPPGIISPPGFGPLLNGYSRPTHRDLNHTMFNDPFYPDAQHGHMLVNEQAVPGNLSGVLPPSISGRYGHSRGSISSSSNYMFGR